MSGATIITGASSGIGRELAIQLAPGSGVMHLIGRDPARTEEVAELCRQAGGSAEGHVLDLEDFEEVDRWFRGITHDGTIIEAIYHCAARASFGEIRDHSLSDLEWVYRVNLLSVAQFISLVFPSMVRRRSGKIVLLSSLSAFTGFPMVTAYAASKQGLLALARSIGAEAADAGVDVHVACPGFVETRIFKAGRYRDCSEESVVNCVRSLRFPFLTAEEAARRLLAGIGRGRRLIVFPLYAKLMAFVGFRLPLLLRPIQRKIVRSLSEEPGR